MGIRAPSSHLQAFERLSPPISAALLGLLHNQTFKPYCFPASAGSELERSQLPGYLLLPLELGLADERPRSHEADFPTYASSAPRLSGTGF